LVYNHNSFCCHLKTLSRRNSHGQSSIVNRQSSIVNRQSSIVNRQSSIVNRQSSIVNNSVKGFARLSSALAISTLLFGQAAVSAPFSYEYNDTLKAGTTTVGVSAGQPAKITVTLDNGGTTRNSQTWTSAHLKAVTFNFNNGTVVTTFCTPFGGTLDNASGDFVSDGSGALTGVMTNWSDNNTVGTDFTTNSTGGTATAWYLNGANGMYTEDNWTTQALLTNVGDMMTAPNWATSTLIGSCTPSSPPVSAPVVSLDTQPVIFSQEIEMK